MKEKIGFGVIGCGHIGVRHIQVIQENKEAKLHGVFDILDKKEQYPHIPFASFEDILSNTEIDVVQICTPNGLHINQAERVLNAGKHVVVEKPMGLTAKNCLDLNALAAQKNRHVFCVMQNRFSPASLWLKQIVGSGALGKIHFIQVNCFWNRDHRYYTPNSWRGTPDLDGGVLYTQFSHFIDLIYWLFGEIDVRYADFFNLNHAYLDKFEDTGLVQFDLKKGGKGSFNFSTSVYNHNLESSVSILAEKGTIKVGGQYMNKLEYCDVEGMDVPVLPESAPPNDYGAYKGSAANHFYIIQNVIDVLKRNAPIATSGEEGAKVVRMIEDMYKFKK